MSLFVAVPPIELDLWDTIPLPGIEVAGVEFSEDGDLQVSLTESGERVEAPIFFALACLDRRNQNLIEAVAAHPYAESYFANSKLLPPIENHARAPAILLSAAAEIFGRFVHQLSEMTLAHAETRQAYEKLHDRFSRLETFVQHGAAKLLRQRLELPPDTGSDGLPLRTDLCEGTISQLLPTASSGLAVIELCIQFAPEETNSSVRAALFLDGEQQPIASWRITAADIASDNRWVALGLHRALDPPAGDLVLTLEATDISPARVWVAQSTLQPNQAYCLRDAVNARPATSRPMALRIWEAPAGLRVPISAGIIPPVGFSQDLRGGKGSIVRLPAPILRQVRSGSDDGWAEGFMPVSFDGDDEAVCIHPPPNGVTIGVLDRAVARDAVRVSATAYIVNERSKPVDFALAVVDPDREGGSRGKAPVSAAVAWSDWVRVSPGPRQRMTALLANDEAHGSSDRRPLTLKLITKMAESGDNRFAWARIADVSVECL